MWLFQRIQKLSFWTFLQRSQVCVLYEKLQNGHVTIFTGGRLKITPGVTLKFEHSIGMMIAGEIIAEGDLKGGKIWLLDLVQDFLTNLCLLEWYLCFKKKKKTNVVY